MQEARENAAYVTLDDALARSAAATSPASFLKAQGDQVVIDEVQREPGLFRELKRLVDLDRKPGRFLLTGSANILLLPKLADSLAGRMEIVPLWPLSQGEIEGKRDAFADWAFTTDPVPKIEPANDLGDRVEKGGFPEPFARASTTRRQAWFEAYIRALLDRDVRDMADIEGLNTLPRLLAIMARQPYEVLNISSLARDTGVPHTTLTRYLSLLQGVFLLKSFPAWTTTEAKAAKTERMAFVDSGVQRFLSGFSQATLPEIESFLAMELLKQSGWATTRYEVMHFRSVRHHSVPLVLRARTGKLVGLTVIDRSEPEPGDFKALQFFKDVAGADFHRGFVLHRGDRCQMVEENLGVLPISAVWRV